MGRQIKEADKNLINKSYSHVALFQK